MYFFGPSASEIGQEVGKRIYQNERNKKKTIERRETKKSITKYRFKPVEMINVGQVQATFQSGDCLPSLAPIKKRIIETGYPILNIFEYTHHFCNKSGKYLKSEFKIDRFINLKHQSLVVVSNDLSSKERWKPALNRHGEVYRLTWESSFLEKTICEWVEDLSELDVMKNRAIYNK